MIQIKQILLKTIKKKIEVSSKLSEVFVFTYKDKNHKCNSEQYIVNISNVPEEDIPIFVRNHFQKMLDNFNKTLRVGESKRTLLNVYRINTVINLIKL